MEHRRPGARTGVDIPVAGGEHQSALGTASFNGFQALDAIPVHVAQQFAGPLLGESIRLAEDVYLGVVVDSEGLVRRLVIELNGAQVGEGGNLGRQIEAQFTIEQQPVVLRGHGVAHGQPGDGEK